MKTTRSVKITVGSHTLWARDMGDPLIAIEREQDAQTTDTHFDTTAKEFTSISDWFREIIDENPERMGEIIAELGRAYPHLLKP